MTDLRNAAKLALEEWRTEPGSVRMASLMMALERALAEDAMDRMAENARELGLHKDYARGYVAGMDSKLFADDTSQERVDKVEEQRHEPVAMRWDFDGYGYRYIDSGSGSNWQTRVKDAEPLYDRPQQCPNCASLMEQNTELDKKLSEWVGLTDDERRELRKRNQQHDALMLAAEKLLMEKNRGV